MAIKIQESANPAAVGFRWTAPESGTEYEIVWHRHDGRDWTMGAKPADGPWIHYGTAPGIVKAGSLADARRIARAFVDGDE